MKNSLKIENVFKFSLFSILILYSFKYIPFFYKSYVLNDTFKYVLLVVSLIALFFIDEYLTTQSNNNVIFDFSISLSLLYFVSRIIPILTLVLYIGILYMFYKLCTHYFSKFKESDGNFLDLLLLILSIFGLIFSFLLI
ncbi:hypothetical protein [Clostridium chrysemydis]|uniref:hypothetical protein n=1 Tax=Clostridium chrysemydis TaxID=2665504 RepID=UPI001883EBA2|nr:hypothetical protein [Clostridium chrysemydis]